MRTTAARQGECWVINGSKSFITHGRIGGVMVVMAVTDRTQGPSRHLGIHRRAWHARHDGGQEGEQARHARQRHERGRLRRLPRAADAAARRGRAGVHQHAAGARRRPDRDCRAVGRPGAGRVRGGPRLREGAPPVRPADRRVPGHPVEARRQCDADRGGAAADLSRGLSERPGRADDARVVHGEAVRERDRGQGRGRLRADSRRLRVREGLSGGEVLPRRQAADDRRGHERDPAARHRAAASGTSERRFARRPRAGGGSPRHRPRHHAHRG